MPKIKTHKGCAKKFNKRKNDYKIGKGLGRHNTGKKSAKFNRSKRKGSTISSGDYKRLKNII